MNFDSPARLALVIAPLLLLVAYFVVLHARQKYVVRFTSVDLLASVAPRRPGWQRHIAAALVLMALLLLVIGFAEPMHAVKVPRHRATVLIAVDVSGSMSATDVSPNRLAAAKQAATAFVNRLPAGIEIGLISFSNDANVVVPPSTNHRLTLDGLDKLQAGGGTATAAAIRAALSTVASKTQSAGGGKSSAELVLLSDGKPTIGVSGADPAASVASATAAAKSAHVRIDTIAFGTEQGTVVRSGETVPVPADPDAMKAIASGSGGKTFSASSLDELTKVYESIRRTVGYDSKQQSLAVWFIGAALIALCAAAAAALVWTQRML